MSIWAKADYQQVSMNISGNVLAEHLDFLKNNMLERFRYGYRRIILNINEAESFDKQGIPMLSYMQELLEKGGGEFLIEDAKDLLKG